MDYNIEIDYGNARKKVKYFFRSYHQLSRFSGLCVGNLDTANADFTLTATQATECSKVNTMAIQYGIDMKNAAMLRDIFNYGRIAKGDYKIIVNGVTYTCRPVITLMLKRAK